MSRAAAAVRMSHLAALTAAAAVAFVVAGALSGALLDARGGAAGALEWVLRTVTVLAAAVTVVGGLVLVVRVRRRIRPRPLGWLVAALAAAAFLWVVAIPVAYAVYLTHLPTRRAVHDADLGAAKQAVALKGADGVTLRGWYVPS